MITRIQNHWGGEQRTEEQRVLGRTSVSAEAPAIPFFAFPLRTPVLMTTFLMAYGDVSVLTRLPLVARMTGRVICGVVARLGRRLGPASCPTTSTTGVCSEVETAVRGVGSPDRGAETPELLLGSEDRELLEPLIGISASVCPRKARRKLGEGGLLKISSAAEGGGRKIDLGDAS